MRRIHRFGIAAVVSAGLIITACSDSSSSDSKGNETTTTAAAEDSAALQWALDYVGGTAGAASGDPIKIGYATSSDLFPDSQTAAELTVAYVNEKLGGVGGRPIELVNCNLAVPEDGAKCGNQFANDPSIAVAVEGQGLFGNGDYNSTLKGKKPLYIAAPSALEDFISTAGVSYFGGALGVTLGIAGFIVEDLKPTTIGVIVTDDAAGRGGFSVLQPILASEGADVRPVFVSPTATAPEVEGALQAVNVNEIDALIVGVFESGCIATYDALKNLGVDATTKPIVAVSPCHGAAMQQHIKDAGEAGILPNGWYFGGSGYNVFTGNAESGTDTMIDIVTASGKPELAYSVGVEEVVSGLMSIVKILNAANGDYSFATLDAALRGFTGPAMSAAGPVACGAPAIFKGICTQRASIERYIDGGWEATRSGDNSIDISPFMSPAG